VGAVGTSALCTFVGHALVRHKPTRHSLLAHDGVLEFRERNVHEIGQYCIIVLWNGTQPIRGVWPVSDIFLGRLF
jgi:hypothetical protein